MTSNKIRSAFENSQHCGSRTQRQNLPVVRFFIIRDTSSANQLLTMYSSLSSWRARRAICLRRTSPPPLNSPLLITSSSRNRQSRDPECINRNGNVTVWKSFGDFTFIQPVSFQCAAKKRIPSKLRIFRYGEC